MIALLTNKRRLEAILAQLTTSGKGCSIHTMSYQAMNKPLDWFSDNPENYRSHPPEQQAVLQESLRRFGVFRNVVARPDGTLLAGHGIIAAARAEGLTEFPCVVFEGTDAEARALMVADNEQARLAQDDPDQLTQLLASLQDDGMMQVTGHDDASFAELLEQVEAQAAPTGFHPDMIPRDDAEATATRQVGIWEERDKSVVTLGRYATVFISNYTIERIGEALDAAYGGGAEECLITLLRGLSDGSIHLG